MNKVLGSWNTLFIMDPTREENILDPVVGNKTAPVSDIHVSVTFSPSDHWYLTFNINISAPELLTEMYLNFRSADWDTICPILDLIDWDNIFPNCGGIDTHIRRQDYSTTNIHP